MPRIVHAMQLVRSNRAGSGHVSEARSDGVPPVYVTIGRVEVRALASPERPPRAAKSGTPRLTLDDYLRKRNQSMR